MLSFAPRVRRPPTQPFQLSPPARPESQLSRVLWSTTDRPSSATQVRGLILDPADSSPLTVELLGPGGNATVQSNLPAATYTATLPTTMFDNSTGTVITGTITGVSTAGGTGVIFSVNFANLPSVAAYGPFGQSCPYLVPRYVQLVPHS